ncbi:hypothetical protein TNCV_223421 [Trichonephila clavipes]|nr:hypothetical protein TNCV_223421 [Trichonephila clavipes]
MIRYLNHWPPKSHKETRGTELVILSLSQMTRKTPERAPYYPNFHTMYSVALGTRTRCSTRVCDQDCWDYAGKLHSKSQELKNLFGGHGSREVKIPNLWPACHKFEDPTFREGRWTKNMSSRFNVFPLVWCGSLKSDASSGVIEIKVMRPDNNSPRVFSTRFY